MEKSVQNFTRYIYSLHYACETFNEFKLIHRTILYSTLDPNRFDLAYRIELEPHKRVNSNSTGVKYYLAHFESNRMKDLTGLRYTHLHNILFGDLNFLDSQGYRKKVLLLCQILPQEKQLVIDVFDKYYPGKVSKQ